MTKREILETWFQRVWHDEDRSVIPQMMRPDMRVEGLRATPQHGPEEFRLFVDAMLGLVSDMRITIAHFIESGDWASGLIQVTAKCRKTGKPVSFDGQFHVRFDDQGNLAEGYNHIDFISLYEQLGLMPTGTLAHCLGGAALPGTQPQH